MNPDFWNARRVFLTGHTGFKGAWLALWLERMGARVTGYSLAPDTEPSLYELLAPWSGLTSIIGDVRDASALRAALESSEPEIVIHMAAQALVRRSYLDPIDTFSTNVLGTATLLNALRSSDTVRVVLVVTSDKVYEQRGPRPFVEDDRLGGGDPYSASKAMQELAASSFAHSFLAERSVAVATARAGNVIGGGDWAPDRLVADYYRALAKGEPFVLRYPNATRPWQHVLDPLGGYLTYLERLTTGSDVPPALNFGPTGESLTVQELISRLAHFTGQPADWNRDQAPIWPEHETLALDSSAAAACLDWRPRLSVEDGVRWTASWHAAHHRGEPIREFTGQQIDSYMGLEK
jgi:CDP-glucose 4,6-dehydratase